MAEAAKIISIAIWRRGVPAVLAAYALLTVGPTGGSYAQQPMPQQQEQQQQFSVEQINQLVAPIALYPDNLLGQVLAASTYPLEVVVAARWAQSNKNVTGQALEEAMQLQSWDASVKALCAVPQVLAMMSEKVEWTQQLGAAYLAQPDDIAIAVQNLRARADASGNLKETNQVKVRRVSAPPPPSVYLEPPPPEYIVIEPYDPAYLYVPYYDPFLVYGVWPYAAYRPWYWYPPGYVAVGVIGYGAPIFVGSAIWAHYHWGSRSVHVNVNYYNKFHRTNIVSTGGGTKWQQNSKFAKAANVNFKPGQGGKPGSFQATKFNAGSVGKPGVQTIQGKPQGIAGTNQSGGGKPTSVQTIQGKPQGIAGINQSGSGKPASSQTFQGKPQGIAGVNQNIGNKAKINTGNPVRTNLANTQRVNAGQSFRAPTSFKPNVSAPRVNTTFKKK
jgi:uncharacterized protein DUF3300